MIKTLFKFGSDPERWVWQWCCCGGSHAAGRNGAALLLHCSPRVLFLSQGCCFCTSLPPDSCRVVAFSQLVIQKTSLTCTFFESSWNCRGGFVSIWATCLSHCSWAFINHTPVVMHSASCKMFLLHSLSCYPIRSKARNSSRASFSSRWTHFLYSIQISHLHGGVVNTTALSTLVWVKSRESPHWGSDSFIVGREQLSVSTAGTRLQHQGLGVNF